MMMTTITIKLPLTVCKQKQSRQSELCSIGEDKHFREENVPASQIFSD